MCKVCSSAWKIPPRTLNPSMCLCTAYGRGNRSSHKRPQAMCTTNLKTDIEEREGERTFWEICLPHVIINIRAHSFIFLRYISKIWCQKETVWKERWFLAFQLRAKQVFWEKRSLFLLSWICSVTEERDKSDGVGYEQDFEKSKWSCTKQIQMSSSTAL
jgi:hypothetical protein